jgi:hypothetical protein
VGSIPTVSIFFLGVSHSGQLQGTVNPSSPEYVGSNPTTPTLFLQHDFPPSASQSVDPLLRNFYALGCNKLQQISRSLGLSLSFFYGSSIFSVKQVKQVKHRGKTLSHLKNQKVKQVKQKPAKINNFCFEMRKNCVNGKCNNVQIDV